MKGSNELKLNQETINEALQEYLSKRIVPPPKVVSVSLEKSNYGNDEHYSVKIEAAGEPTP